MNLFERGEHRDEKASAATRPDETSDAAARMQDAAERMAELIPPDVPLLREVGDGLAAQAGSNQDSRTDHVRKSCTFGYLALATDHPTPFAMMVT